jgi:epoxyqueuosine reductase QueG
MPQRGEEQSAQIKKFAVAQGADLVGIAPVETYADYGSQVDVRIRETEATRRDFMIRDHDVAFFDRLSNAANTLPGAQAVVIIGVYAYDGVAVYRRAR